MTDGLRITVQRTVLVSEEVALPLRMSPQEAREHGNRLIAAADAVDRTEPRWGGIPAAQPTEVAEGAGI